MHALQLEEERKQLAKQAAKLKAKRAAERVKRDKLVAEHAAQLDAERAKQAEPDQGKRSQELHDLREVLAQDSETRAERPSPVGLPTLCCKWHPT